MKRILVLALVCACSTANAQLVLDTPSLIKECQARATVVSEAVEAHNKRLPRADVGENVRLRIGSALKYPEAQTFINQITEHVYTAVPITDAAPVSADYYQLCFENPDQYVGRVSIIDWNKVNR